MIAGADRKVVYALLGIAALCLIGLGASLYRAKSGELSRLRQDLTTKEKQLGEVKVKLIKQPDLEAKYAQLQTRLSVLEPSLPDSAYMPTFLRQIERLATETNNNIVSIRPRAKARSAKGGSDVKVNNETGEVIKPATADEKQQGGSGKSAGGDEDTKSKIPYDYSLIELKVDGTYSTTLAFLTALQRFPKMIAVNDIAFSPKATGLTQRIPELTATMDLTAVVSKGAKNGAT
jgi:Tfp pilus assembly protein PilO